jgi:hypothetical protein
MWLLVYLSEVPHVANADSITSKMRIDDRRLESRVNISARRIRLGDLLERITTQTGIKIACSERDGGSGTYMSAHADGIPVGDLLDAVWSLTANQDAQWRWEREGTSADYRYTLVQPERAKRRSELIREYVKQAAVYHFGAMLEIARMPAEDRVKNKKLISQSLGVDEDHWADGFLNSPGLFDIHELVAACVPRDKLITLIRGETSASVPIDSLSATGKQWLEKCQGMIGLDAQSFRNDPVGDAAPKTLHFYPAPADRQTELIARIAPLIMLSTSKHFGISVLGGTALEAGMGNVVRKKWNVQGDKVDTQLANRLVDKPIEMKTPPFGGLLPGFNGRPPRPRPIPSILEIRLLQMAQGSGVPILMILPATNLVDPGDPSGHTVRDTIESAKKRFPKPMFKWRNGVLLASYPQWFVEEDGSIPYALAKKYLNEPNLPISLKNMVNLMVAITDRQAFELSLENAAVKSALEIRPLLILASRYPQLVSPAGMRMTPSLVNDLTKVAKISQHPSFLNGTLKAIRLVQIDEKVDGKASIAMRTEIQTDTKAWISLGGFIQIPRSSTP